MSDLNRLEAAGIVGSDAQTALAAYRAKGPLRGDITPDEAAMFYGQDAVRVWAVLRKEEGQYINDEGSSA